MLFNRSNFLYDDRKPKNFVLVSGIWTQDLNNLNSPGVVCVCVCVCVCVDGNQFACARVCFIMHRTCHQLQADDAIVALGQDADVKLYRNKGKKNLGAY